MGVEKYYDFDAVDDLEVFGHHRFRITAGVGKED